MPILLSILFSLLITQQAFSADLEGSKVKGFDFSYVEIEKNCTVNREGQDSLSVSCKGGKLKSVSRSCGGYISRGLESAKLNCGGSLWVLNQRCKIEMRGADYGEINCKI
ncbi:MAG: hypothetical protein JXR04_09695 [Bermanella sp.]